MPQKFAFILTVTACVFVAADSQTGKLFILLCFSYFAGICSG
jgi:hypothetical protein